MWLKTHQLLTSYFLTNELSLQSCHILINASITIAMKELSFEELFLECFYPIWNYGKDEVYSKLAPANDGAVDTV